MTLLPWTMKLGDFVHTSHPPRWFGWCGGRFGPEHRSPSGVLLHPTHRFGGSKHSVHHPAPPLLKANENSILQDQRGVSSGNLPELPCGGVNTSSRLNRQSRPPARRSLGNPDATVLPVLGFLRQVPPHPDQRSEWPATRPRADHPHNIPSHEDSAP